MIYNRKHLLWFTDLMKAFQNIAIKPN